MGEPTPGDQFAPRGVALPTWLSRLGGRAGGGGGEGGPGPRGGGLRGVGALFGILLLLFLIVLGLRALRGDSKTDSASKPAVTAAADGNGDGGDGSFQVAPGFRIYPQRAEAGPPLQLEVTGRGCPGSSGALTITEIGTASEAGGADRLVVRRRFAVDSNRAFVVTPLLVGQPPGSYRVVAACERQPTAEAPDAAARRDLYTMTEVLELTGGKGAREFRALPPSAAPNLTTQIALSGSGCGGSGAQAAVRVFPPNVGNDPVPTEQKFKATGGSWQGTYTVAAPEATGTYVIEARCVDDEGTAFAYITRTVRFGNDRSPASDLGLPSLFDFLLPEPPSAAPPAADRAVGAVPSFTG